MNIVEFRNANKSYLIKDIDGNDTEYLSGLSKINIFVGANNSGKSTFLRYVLSHPNDFIQHESLADLNAKMLSVYEGLPDHYKKTPYYIDELRNLAESRGSDYAKKFNDFVATIDAKKKQSNGTSVVGLNGTIWDVDVAAAIKNLMVEKSLFQSIINVGEGIITIDYTGYIPILRGLRPLGQPEVNTTNPDDKKTSINNIGDVYQIRTEFDYSEHLKEADVFTGLGLYAEIRAMLLGTKDEREEISRFESFLGRHFFQDGITLIPAVDSDVLRIDIEEEKDMPIYKLGDGIQSIIINTFQAFKHQNEHSLLFIEEPEMLMHPSMQRVLMETLIKEFPKLQVFLTTHSNHFLDLTYDYPNDVSIFSFEKVKEKEFRVKDITGNSTVLDLLGVRNSSVFLANGVIWTEGVTDRMLFKVLLRLDGGLDKKYIEDRHYTFAEYGGSNLEHYSFNASEEVHAQHVQAISRSNFLLADNDGKTGNDEKSLLIKAREMFSEDHVFTEYREVENLIPFKVWVEVVKNYGDRREFILKDGYEDNEDAFNTGLLDHNESIGKLLFEYIIVRKEGADAAYLDKTTIECLGGSGGKRRIMMDVVEQIGILKLTIDDFPQTTKDAVDKLKSFVEEVNS